MTRSADSALIARLRLWHGAAWGPLAALYVSGCAVAVPAAAPRHSPVAATVVSCLSSADRIVERGIAEGVFPGAVLAVGNSKGLFHLRPFGRLSFAADSRTVSVDTIYDVASLTKVVVTTTLAMILVDRGRLDLDAPLSAWFPPFAASKACVRDLLAHSSGLPEWEPLYKEVSDKRAVIERVSGMEASYEPGSRSVYSDLGMILLGEIIEREAGMSLDLAAKRWVFDPLRMAHILYRPGPELRQRVAPTGESVWRGRVLRGEVQDENAYRMGGIAGHAGLFAAAPALARFAEMWLGGGVLDGLRIVRPATSALFMRRVDVPGSSRALGWETAAGDPWAGALWSARAVGHTGLTGTVIWLDPEQDMYLILLANRRHGEEGRPFGLLRKELSDAVVTALRQAHCGASRGR